MIEYRQGNLIEAFKKEEIDIIVHGCNCYTTMGAGIAKQIKNCFPQAYQADLDFDKKFEYPNPKDKSIKLGKFSCAKIDRFVHIDGVSYNNEGWIVNAYTQDTHWDKTRMLSYEAIRQCFQTLNESISPILRVGIPFIGCGLARGDWRIVEGILNEIFTNRTIYVFYLNEQDFCKNLYKSR
jgi:O-acetyl-ADP-ribose deacetylase (regulator of RNase III)